MIRSIAGLFFVISIVATFPVLHGCSDSGKKKFESDSEFLIRVEKKVVTVSDFNKAFETAKAAYSHNEIQNPEVVRDIQLMLVNQLTEEMILQQRADELGIHISDSELDKAVSDVKKDFPKNVFEQVLLEYAVSYDNWKAGLRHRLLMKKVIAKELGEQIKITPDDVLKYYRKQNKDNDFKSGPIKNPKDINKNIVTYLRSAKLEDNYRTWIQELRKKYKIKINNSALKKMVALGSKGA